MAPVGATSQRPVFVVLLGGGARDRLTTDAAVLDECEQWSTSATRTAFALCSTGMVAEGDAGHSFRDEDTTKAGLKGALAALKSRFGDYVGGGTAILVGTDEAADHAAAIAAREPEFFSELVMIDGGHERWTAGVATRFARAGGRRVLFVCTNLDCPKPATRALGLVRRANLEGRMARGKSARGVLLDQWNWLVERADAWAASRGVDAGIPADSGTADGGASG